MTTIAFLGELIGTMLLILLGDGVVANVVLNRTKGQNSGWIVVTFGWAMAVFVGVLVSAPVSKAHLNPAVTIALAAAGQFEWGRVPFYILAQMIGACIGALLVWIHYKSHFEITENKDAKRLSSAQYRHSLTGIESRVRGDRDLRAGLCCPALHESDWRVGIARRAARRVGCPGDRPLFGWNDRLRDQPGARHRPAPDARAPADSRQTRQ